MNSPLIHSLLGTALGDSLGLPSEGMSRSRIAKRWKGPLEQRRHRGDFSTIVSEVIACGGDTDSVTAIVGGIAGAETATFNPEWLGKLSDHPYTVDYLTRLGTALAESVEGGPMKPPSVANWQIIPRNIIFLLTVLIHGFRRIFPPY